MTNFLAGLAIWVVVSIPVGILAGKFCCLGDDD